MREQIRKAMERGIITEVEAATANKVADWRESWINGNRKDVVVELIENGLLSDAIAFAGTLDHDDRETLLKMLRNRDK